MVSLEIAGLFLSQDLKVAVSNLLIRLLVALFLKHIFQQLKKGLLKPHKKVFLQAFRVLTLRLQLTMEAITLLTPLKWRLNLLAQ
ncbi:hypothetical protein MCHI_001186 [Candidatus Magnetoovum chiemensis]|nr:hypothetical protein MCHI_001186 [Candidatus Magnetoovum chiemensis]